MGVHIDCQLDWNGHIKSIKNKIAKNVSVMNRVKHLLNSHALYSLYTTLIIPYMNYCCEFWGNFFFFSRRVPTESLSSLVGYG